MIYDVLVIGGGPAGCKAAELAGKANLKVALFEKDKLGGVCLNHGCIPTKSLLYGIKLLHHINKEGPLFGITADKANIDPLVLWQRATRTVSDLRFALQAKLKSSHVNIVFGKAQWKRKNDYLFEVCCNEKVFCGRYLILATGGQPIIPSIPGIKEGMESNLVVTPRDLLETKTPDIPKSLVILGGGTIGMEFATIYSGLGSKVTIVEKNSAIGGGIDTRISDFLLNIYSQRNITFYLNTTATNITEKGLILQATKHIEADKILLACGWQSISHNNLPGVHVVGDANGQVFLAPVAEQEAEHAVRQILGIPSKMSYTDIPHVIFTNPEIAYWGKTLKQAQFADPDATEISFFLKEASSRYAIEHPFDRGFCIKVFSGQGHLIGAHMIGTGVSEILNSFSSNTFHPSLGELIRFGQ